MDPDATFTPPNGQDVNGVLTTVPDVAGVPYDQAASQIRQAGFQVADGGYRDSGYSTDTVAYTSPGAGSQVASGSTITIYRSNGTPYVPHGHGPGHGHGQRGTARHTAHGCTPVGRASRPRRSSAGDSADEPSAQGPTRPAARRTIRGDGTRTVGAALRPAA